MLTDYELTLNKEIEKAKKTGCSNMENYIIEISEKNNKLL